MGLGDVLAAVWNFITGTASEHSALTAVLTVFVVTMSALISTGDASPDSIMTTGFVVIMFIYFLAMAGVVE